MHIPHRTPDKRRGISTVIAGTIIILLIIVGVVPLLMLYLSTAQAVLNTYNLRSTYEELRNLERVEANVSNGVLTIANIGPVPIDITFITLRNSDGICSFIVNLYEYITSVPNSLVSSSNATLNSVQKAVRIEQGGYVKLNITGLIQRGAEDVCSVTTARGNIIEVSKIVSATIVEKAKAIIVTPVILDVATLANRADITVSETQIQPAVPPDNTGTGMSRIRSDGYGVTALVRYAYIKSTKSDTPCIKIIGGSDPTNPSVWVKYNNIYVGYSPEWSRSKQGPPRYNILITGYVSIDFMIFNNSIIPQFYNKSTPTYHDYVNDYYVFHLYDIPYRIKIIDYMPSDGHLKLKYDIDHDGELESNELLIDEEALGYWWLYSGTECAQGYFELNGTASEVIVYVDASDMGYDDIVEASYDPYLFSADADGNGYPEFLFITEDIRCSGYIGNNPTYNDVSEKVYFKGRGVSAGEIWADDWTARKDQKFFINFTGYTINGKDTLMIQLAVRVYFHDNLAGDTDEVDYTDRTIFGIYLIDASSGKVVSSREWIYQELDDLEDTFPPNKNFVMLTATLVVPENGTYYLAIAFQDPYSDYVIDYQTPWPCSDAGYDDGDFTVALEVAGITLFARP